MDPDGETATIIDDEGHALDNDQALLALLTLVTEAKADARVALPVSVTREAERIAEEGGATITWTKLSAPHLMEVASADGVDFAASQDGGFIWPDFMPAFDATATLVKLLDLLAGTGRTLSSVVKRLPRLHIAHETVATPWERKGAVMREMVERAGPARRRARGRGQGAASRRLGSRPPRSRGGADPRLGRRGERPERPAARPGVRTAYPPGSEVDIGAWSSPISFGTRKSTSGSRRKGARGRVGITDFAQDALGDVVFVQLPDVGANVSATSSIAEVESTKSVSDIYAPVGGTIVEVNTALESTPEQLNQDPYGDGWIFVIEMSDAAQVDSLLDAAAYRRLVEEQ